MSDESPEFFDGVGRIGYAGPDTDDPLAFRWYDAERVVRGRTMRDHLRVAVCYWHSFNWDGFDIFGEGTLDRPWLDRDADPMKAAEHKMAAAFEFMDKLGAPFWTFHDFDIAPEGATFAESAANLDAMVDRAAAASGAHRRRAAVGNRKVVRQPPVHGRSGDESRPRRVRLRGGPDGSEPCSSSRSLPV